MKEQDGERRAHTKAENRKIVLTEIESIESADHET